MSSGVVRFSETIRRMLAFCLLVVICPVATTLGAEWTSPDGVIRVTVPDAEKFEALETPPTPFLVLWISADETLRLGVMQTPFPAGQRLVRSAADKGFAEEIGGSITADTTTTSNGHEIWLTTVSGSSAGTKMTATQAIVRVNDSAYKIMAMTVGDGAVDEATIQPFLQSIQVTGPPHPGGIAGGSSAKTPLTSDELMQKVSYNIGRAVGMILMILLVVWVVSLFNRRPRNPNPVTQYTPGPPNQ